ncbi:hypothetical protein BDZ45DRAFT_696624 [Acephala macrosclerotiorum]|nr:hypothetical protein BDZ45DRAFT_696624 [Acephala macrosclerotiorum]
MTCHICKEMTKAGNDATDHSFDNFQRFYARHWLGGKEEISRHEYRYEELQDREHTRLLELLPGNDDEQITCLLAEAPIDDPPRYSALSYTWGTTPRTKTVLVNDQNFLVTNNLWVALWHLRLPDRKRIIWIDAICIDQSNIEERSRVVLRMKDIYERADEIIAWLGPEGSEGTLALSCIERVFDHYNRLFDRLGSQEATFQHMLVHRSWTGESEKGGPLVLQKQPLNQTSARAAWLTIEKLLQGRTWFRRVWIVQEGTVPVRTTFYLCRQSLRADALYLVFRLLESIPPNTFPNDIVKTVFTPHIAALTTFAQKRFELRRSDKGKNFALLDVLSTLRNHSAGDPHDKVYSALGFATDMNLPIEVDYKKPFSEMLLDVAVSFLHETSHNLRFLGHAGLLGTDHMPATWIPDWLHSNLLTPFPKEAYRPGSEDAEILFDACAINHPVWKEAEYAGLRPSVEGHTLKAQGILVDFVRTASVSAGSLHDLDSIENIWYIENMHKPYTPTGETLEEAYLRTLVADLKMKDGKVVERGGSMYWRNRTDSPPPPDHTDIQHMLQQICISRRFISTLKHRYIGLAPLYVEPGDAIFMLKGGEMLYLARPTLAGTYHFVGEAYVHGKMDGQVMQDFERGQGTMQTVEFIPVLNTVLDSTKSTSTIPGKPVDVKFTDREYGVVGEEYSNPYEHMHPYFHSNIGPQMDPIILQAIEEVTMACSQAGMTRTEVIKKIFIEQVWAKAVEEKLLSYEEAQMGSSSIFQLAGRRFARRSYILAAIELEKERNRVQVLGQFQNVAPYKDGVHVLDADIIEDKDKEEWNDPKSKENQMAEDAKLAQELQAQEFASANVDMGRNRSGPGTVPNSEPDKSSGRDRFPLLNPRTGPPVRLMVSETENPCTQSYKFQSNEDGHQFLEEFKRYSYSGGRERVLKRPLLFGRWATDPRKRPQVTLHTYGQPPDIWWEDEEGNVVEGPDINTSPDDEDITRGDTAWDEDVRFGGWEGEEEADLPSEFLLID